MSDVSLSITKEFGSIVAVDNIDLKISDGEFLTLVGPSGCGKTTTLRIVAGLEQPTTGTVKYGDKDVTGLPPQERDVALLFQDIALYPHMTVRENMAYGLMISGVKKPERNKKVENAAEMLQISDLLDNKPGSLSGGQQQRVALGRSIVRDPEVFLFDEPMSDLDAKLKRELRPLIVEVTEEVGCPTLYVTHDQEEAITMSDRVAVMNDGQIEQVGTPREIYNKPNSRFVGEFIGQPAMEFFDTIVSRRNGKLTVEVDAQSFAFLATEGVEISPGDQVTLGIRPQDIEVSSKGQGITATHVLDELHGDETHSFFDTEYGRVTAVTSPEFDGGQNEYVLSLDENMVHMFDQKTGNRIA